MPGTSPQIAPLPSDSGLNRVYGNFSTFGAALDYAAEGASGYNIYSGRGQLIEALSYKDLRTQAIATAKKLLSLGLNKADRVAIVAESDGDFARIFFGCQYAGLIPAPMPLPIAFGGRDAYVATLRGMIGACGAKAVVIPEVISGWTDEIVAGLTLTFGGSPASLLSSPINDDIDLPPVDEDDISYLQFSSGSTRFPMGVEITQKAGLANAHAIAKYGLQVRETGDRCVSWLPLYHDMGLVGFFLTPMSCQLTTDLLPTREFARRPQVWLDLISRNRGTIAYSPSFGYELCARRPPAPGIDLSCWRVAGVGGDMIRPHILESFAQNFAPASFRAEAFVASYGMAETTLAISFARLDKGIFVDTIDLKHLENEQVARGIEDEATRGRAFVVCGHALPRHEMQVRDSRGETLPDRAIGTIYVRGPSMMSGYYGREKETKAVLSADGWLDTGDLGYMLSGQVVITGRAKDLMVINGRNIWPQDIEWSAEAAVTGLRSRDVAVFSIERESEELIYALVQCRLTTLEARAEMQENIASLIRRRHGVDVTVVLIPPHTLPQTSSGKLTRAKAKTMYLAGQFAQDESSAA